QSRFRFAMTEPELQGGSEVVVFALEPVEPCLLLGVPQVRCRRLAEAVKELRVPGLSRCLVGVIRESFGGEGADGLQQPERWRVIVQRPQQARVDKRGELLQQLVLVQLSY